MHSASLRLCSIAMVLVALTADCGLTEEGWPFVRGPRFDGHADDLNLADSWPSDGPPVLWTRELGQGYSAFIGSGNHVFTQAQSVTGQYVYCLNAITGETVWKHWYDWPYEAAGVYPGPRSTPTISGNRIYFTSPDGLLACLDRTDGSRVWSIELEDVYGIKGSGFGYSCSPTLIDGMLILPVGGENAGVVAFDADSGRELWTSTSDPASYTPAFPIELNKQPMVVCYMQNSVLVLHRTTGEVYARVGLSRGYDEHSAWPIYSEPYLWLAAPFKAGSRLLDLSTPAAKAVWASDLLSNDVCSSVCVDGHVYGFDIMDIQSKVHRPSRGIFRCTEFITGKSRWANGSGRPRRSSNKDEFKTDIGQSGIIAADGKLIILNELGELVLLKQAPNQCTELARCALLTGELTWTAPCLHQRRLYVRNQSRAACVYLGEPDELQVTVRHRASDIADASYFNLAEFVLPVEPEYAFDVPHDRWLVQWLGAGLAILVVSWLLSAGIMRLMGGGSLHLMAVVISVILGAIGTTCIGQLSREFIFTWPVCLYAAFEYVVASGANRPLDEPKQRFGFFTRRLPLLLFLAVSVVYFLLCRRLSLVFEWAFLAGFPGAVPLLWFAYRRRQKCEPTRTASRLAVSLIGFACFFGTGTLLLKSRY